VSFICTTHTSVLRTFLCSSWEMTTSTQDSVARRCLPQCWGRRRPFGRWSLPVTSCIAWWRSWALLPWRVRSSCLPQGIRPIKGWKFHQFKGEGEEAYLNNWHKAKFGRKLCRIRRENMTEQETKNKTIFKVVPLVLLVSSSLPLVVFFAQFCHFAAIKQKSKTKQKMWLKVKMMKWQN
jgi:hypothetical protein